MANQDQNGSSKPALPAGKEFVIPDKRSKARAEARAEAKAEAKEAKAKAEGRETKTGSRAAKPGTNGANDAKRRNTDEKLDELRRKRSSANSENTTSDSESMALAPRGDHAGHAAVAEPVPHVRRSFSNPFHREKSRVVVGDVMYYDGAELSRPLEMPRQVRFGILIAMAIAVIISVVFLVRYFDGIMNEPLRQQQALQENLARPVEMQLPALMSLMPRKDEKIMAYLEGEGLTLYERTPIGTDPDGGFEVIKLPPDVTVEEAGAMYVKGIDRLSAPEAVRLLKGGWTLTVSRKNETSMRLRYADFDSGTIEKAVQNAMAAEGLENATVEDSGVDDSGNTFQAGFVTDKKDRTYSWRVSVIELSEVYSISGLPNTSYFVGVRFTRIPTE